MHFISYKSLDKITSYCHFTELGSARKCFYREIENIGILISSSEPVQVMGAQYNII